MKRAGFRNAGSLGKLAVLLMVSFAMAAQGVLGILATHDTRGQAVQTGTVAAGFSADPMSHDDLGRGQVTTTPVEYGDELRIETEAIARPEGGFAASPIASDSHEEQLGQSDIDSGTSLSHIDYSILDLNPGAKPPHDSTDSLDEIEPDDAWWNGDYDYYDCWASKYVVAPGEYFIQYVAFSTTISWWYGSAGYWKFGSVWSSALWTQGPDWYWWWDDITLAKSVMAPVTTGTYLLYSFTKFNSLPKPTDYGAWCSVSIEVRSGPDLVIDDIWADRTLYAGENFYFNARVRNQGGTAAGAFSTGFYVDDNYLGYYSLGGLGAGQSLDISIWTSWGSSGYHTARATADINHQVSESNENNNDRSESWYWNQRSLPDLIISDVWADRTLYAGDGFYFHARVKNQGGGSAGSFYVGFYVDDNYLGSYYVSGLSAGLSTDVSIWTSWGSQGYHTAKAMADIYYSVSESNENNNALSESWYWYGYTSPDLVIEDIWADRTLYAGESFYFYARVKNQGGGNAGSFYAGFYIDGNFLGSYYIGGLGAGQSTDASIWTSWGSSGYHTARAAADIYSQVSESNENNNDRSESWYWNQKSLPDLIVDDIWTNPSNPIGGRSTTISFRIKNIGGSDANTYFFTSMYIDGGFVGSWMTNWLPAGGSTEASHVTTLDPGSHSIDVETDVTNTIPESNEGNNGRIETITWSQDDAESAKDAPNDFANALPIAQGSHRGWLLSPDTQDWYRFYAATSDKIIVTMRPPTGSDFDLQLYSPSNVLKKSSTYGGDKAESIEFTADSSGDWRMRVYIYSGAGWYDFSLSITSRVTADLRVRVDNKDNEPHTVRYSIDGGGYDRSVDVPSGCSQNDLPAINCRTYGPLIQVTGDQVHLVKAKWIKGGIWYYSDDIKYYVRAGTVREFPFFIGSHPEQQDIIRTSPVTVYESDNHPSINDNSASSAYIDSVQKWWVTSAVLTVSISHEYIGDLTIYVGYEGGLHRLVYNRLGGGGTRLDLTLNLIGSTCQASDGSSSWSIGLCLVPMDFYITHRWYVEVDDGASGYKEGVVEYFRMYLDSDDYLIGSGKYDLDNDGIKDDVEIRADPTIFSPEVRPNPLRKDIFLEVDWMEDQSHNHKIGSAAKTAITNAFHDAPITDPDGTTGISLSVDDGWMGGGQAIPHDGTNQGPFDGDLHTTIDEFVGPWIWDWNRLKNVHDPNGNSTYGLYFSNNRIGIFHYAVFGHDADTPGCPPGGCYGYTWMFDNAIWVSDELINSDDRQANTLMHELGHQLGLNADSLYADQNFTPIDDDVYPSCMRYGAIVGDKGFVDYSSKQGTITVWEWFDSNGDGAGDSWRQATLNTNDWGRISLTGFNS